MEHESKESFRRLDNESLPDFQNVEVDARRTGRPAPLLFLLEDADYKTNHAKRGKAIIFNHKYFENDNQCRNGADVDVKNLTQALLKLGFTETDIAVHTDLRFCEISNVLKKVRHEDHTDSDLLMVFVLTHGNKNDEISAFDGMYPVQTLWNSFTADKCKTLAEKPKIFFIVACRGDFFDSGQQLNLQKQSNTEVDASPISPHHTYTIPVWSDFLYIFSTYKGYYSLRNIFHGTWYIQAFCEEVSRTNFNEVSFTDFLTAVNRRIAVSFEAVNFNGAVKQIPIVSSTLRKALYLTNKN